VLFGGHDGALLADTWEWDGIDWVPRPSDTSPPARNHGGLGYDAARERVDLFGGGGTAVRLADNWYQRELITASISLFGQGCAGAVGAPMLASNGAPRLGWPGFSLQVSSVPQRSTVFLGVSFARRDTAIGPCTVYPQLPFDGVLMAFTHVGQESFRLAIPNDPALRGVRFYAQGGALDPAGALLGLVSLSQAAEARIGD
jgi:hypothetical protein